MHSVQVLLIGIAVILGIPLVPRVISVLIGFWLTYRIEIREEDEYRAAAAARREALEREVLERNRLAKQVVSTYRGEQGIERGPWKLHR